MKKNVERIIKQENELQKIKNAVNEEEKERLFEAAEIAKKLLPFDKIFKEHTTYNNYSDINDKTIYFKDKLGNYIKGIEVAYEIIKDDSDRYGGNKEEIELFLLDDATYQVYIEKIIYSNCPNDSSRYIRELYKNQDLNLFDYDEVIDNIYHEMENRINRLGERAKTQIIGLQKLQELKLS